MATQPIWEGHPSFETAIDSVLLSLASHYAGHTRRGWALMNEAALMIQDLLLYRSQGLSKLSPSDAERCKRLFWIIHMTQMYVFLCSRLVLKNSAEIVADKIRSSHLYRICVSASLHATRTGKR